MASIQKPLLSVHCFLRSEIFVESKSIDAAYLHEV